MSPAQLRAEWRRLHRGHPLPQGLTKSQLQRSIAWRLQEKAFGGLSAAHLRELDRYVQALEARRELQVEVTRKLKPGARLVRKWQDKVYVVTATENGFEHEGRRYTTLTSVAREITGGGWSGPRFFGLKQAKKGA
jgi:hypothetical protein